MQFFDRATVPPPAHLQSRQIRNARNAVVEFFRSGPRFVAQNRLPAKWAPLDHPTVVASLVKLFKGKCAFCETRGPISPYRFRPVSEAHPSSGVENPHIYYSWMAYAWENVYAICQGCIPDDPHHFPVKGKRCAQPTRAELHRLANGNGLWGA